MSMARLRYEMPAERRRSWAEAMKSSIEVSFSSSQGWTWVW
jgi:hypothetical protein